MSSLSNNYVSAALFDLRQDIIADIPRDVIERWLASGQTSEDALAILEPFKVEGYVLSSDTSGLSKLSQQKRLIEVLSMVSYPKEIVFAHGAVLGGRAIGIWAADNTQMFFEKDVDPSALVLMAQSILSDIEKFCEVKIGIGLHYGTFYALGGGLYGPDADFVEGFTEEYVKGGELWISALLRERLVGSHFVFDAITEHEGLFRISGGAMNESGVSFDVEYPLPFSRDFYNDLRGLRGRQDYEQYLTQLEGNYLQDRCVVLVERARQLEGGVHEVALLNDLSLCAVMENDSEDLLSTHHGKEIKTVGPLGIYIFNTTEDACAFAKAFRTELNEKELACRIGIDRGQVLVCDLPNGACDIAGEAVNIASKLAQDKGVFGSIYVSGRCKHALAEGEGKLFSVEVSGVTIEAVEV